MLGIDFWKEFFMKNRNNLVFYLQATIYNCAFLFISGSIVQSFMLESGINESKVSFYVSALQIIQVIVMLVISGLVENIKNIFKSLAFSYYAQCIMVAGMLFFALKQDINVTVKYVVIFSLSIISSLFLGVVNILTYKLPYHIINVKDYGRITGQSGVIVGIAGAAFSGALSLFLGKYKYFDVMTVFLFLAIVMFLATGILMKAYKPIEPDTPNEEKGTKINIFKYKPFYILLAPNFFRGFSFGIYNLAAVIGYYEKALDGRGAGLLVTLSQIATIIACQTYAFLVRRYKNNIIILVSTIGYCLLVPLMLMGNNQIIFLIFYFISYFLIVYPTYAIPVMITEHIDYNCLAQYTAWRMGIYTLGVAVGGMCVPLLLGWFGGMGTLLVCSMTFIPCGLGYYLFERQILKTDIIDING